MSVANRGNGSRWESAAESGILESGAAMEGAGAAMWMEQLQELRAENARLQGLICYLLRANEELRQKDGSLG